MVVIRGSRSTVDGFTNAIVQVPRLLLNQLVPFALIDAIIGRFTSVG
jgi:hypothetical protein